VDATHLYVIGPVAGTSCELTDTGRQALHDELFDTPTDTNASNGAAHSDPLTRVHNPR
jgi:hypothetical protein